MNEHYNTHGDEYEVSYKYKNNFVDDYLAIMEQHHQQNKEKTDEEILEKMDIKNIENFLRKKKLQNLNK